MARELIQNDSSLNICIAISNMWETLVAREFIHNDFSLKRTKILDFRDCGNSESPELTVLEIYEERHTRSNMKHADTSLYFL